MDLNQRNSGVLGAVTNGILEIRIRSPRFARIRNASRLIGIANERKKGERNPLEKMGWGRREPVVNITMRK
jgi:hypothetical protein